MYRTGGIANDILLLSQLENFSLSNPKKSVSNFSKNFQKIVKFISR